MGAAARAGRAAALLGLALLLAPLPAAAQDSSIGHGATAPDASEALDIGGPFSLIDHEGRARSDADYRGNYLLVYFG